MAGAAQVGLQLFGMGAEDEARAEASEYEAYQARFNQKLAKLNAEDAIERGEEAVEDYKVKADKVKGSQKAALAAQGIEIDSGSAAQIEYETDKQIDTDVKRMKNNAWREAWGYTVEAQQYGFSYGVASASVERYSRGNREESKRLRDFDIKQRAGEGNA